MVSTVAILGAGPAGLMLARLLQLSNIDYVIFERDESASWAFGRSGSGTLDLHVGSGLLAMQEAGLLGRFKAIARYDLPIKMADAKGNVFFDRVREGDDMPEIDRKDLRNLLIGSVPAERIRWNMKVQSVGRDTDSSLMSINFTDGTVQSGFRLVVGADGAWSRARTFVTPSRPSYRNLLYLTTSINLSNPYYDTTAMLVGQGGYVALGGEKGIVVYKLGDKSYYVGICLRVPEDWRKENAALLENPDALRQDLCEKFGHWPERHTDLIKHSDGGFHTWPQYSFSPEDLNWESVPGVTLVGDAAHLTVTDGEGVNSALYDSYQLSRKIATHGLDDLDAAVIGYETEMLCRSRERLHKAIQKVDLMFSPDAPLPFLRAMGLKDNQ